MSTTDPKLIIGSKTRKEVTITREGASTTLPGTIALKTTRIQCVGGVEMVSIDAVFHCGGVGENNYSWPATDGLLMTDSVAPPNDSQGIFSNIYFGDEIAGEVYVKNRKLVLVVLLATAVGNVSFSLKAFVLKEV